MHAATCGGDVRAHWHGGPFFEYRRAVGAPPAGASAEERLHTFWAFRPFYSRVRTPEAAVEDVLWPLVTHHSGQTFFCRGRRSISDGSSIPSPFSASSIRARRCVLRAVGAC